MRATVLLPLLATASEIFRAMELHLKPQAETCQISGHVFQEGDRVVSALVRDAAGEFSRWDVLADCEAESAPRGEVLCRWTRIYRPAPVQVDQERELKLTAEALFLELTDAQTEEPGGADANADLKRFLALMLERKRVLKQRGVSENREHIRYEHMPSKRMVEVPAGEMDANFFLEMRAKLGVLLGGGAEPEAPKATASTPEPSETEERG